jgi:TP901 family phage tail tape measure protein
MSANGQLRIRIVGDADGVKPAMSKAVGFVAAGAAAMGAAFIAGVSKALDHEAAADKMAASLGLSGEESKRLGGIAGKLYADAYGDSIETVTGAVESVISSIRGMRGASTAEVQAVTASVLDLATAFEMEAGRAAQVAGQLITTGLARDATHALDLLTVGLQKVPKAVREDLVDALDEYSPFFQGLGLTGEKSMQLLVNASQKGMYGIDKLGDSLKEFTIRATDMSTASKVGYDALGLSQQDMAAKFLAGGETARGAFDQIITGLRGIQDPVKQSQAALALFGVPLEDLSVSEIPQFLAGLDSTTNTLGQVSGAAERMGQGLNDNAKTNLTSFWRTAQMVFVDFLGGKVLPILSNVATWLKQTLGPVLSFVGGVIQNVVLPPLRGLFTWLGQNSDVIGFLVSMIAGGVVGFYAFKTAIMVITGVMRTWTAVTKGLTIAQGLLNVVMAANPIGLVIIAIGALVGAFIWLWNESAGFRDFWISVWNGITSAVGWAVDSVKTHIDGAIKFITDVWNGLLWFFQNTPLGQVIVEIFKAVGRAIGAVVDAIKWLVDRVKSAIDWVQDLLGVASGLSGVGSISRGTGANGKFGGGRALGGEVRPSNFYLVGERGPELFFPGQSGRVLSNVDSEALMATADRDARTMLTSLASGAAGAAPSAGGGGTTVINNFSFPNYLGSREELKKELREAVRTKGRGNAQTFFGTDT